MKSKLSLLAVALAGVFPLAQTAHAQTTAELKQEIELLRKLRQVKLREGGASAPADDAAHRADLLLQHEHACRTVVASLLGQRDG